MGAEDSLTILTTRFSDWAFACKGMAKSTRKAKLMARMFVRNLFIIVLLLFELASRALHSLMRNSKGKNAEKFRAAIDAFVGVGQGSTNNCAKGAPSEQ